jgi:hypothetical protein
LNKALPKAVTAIPVAAFFCESNGVSGATLMTVVIPEPVVAGPGEAKIAG